MAETDIDTEHLSGDDALVKIRDLLPHFSSAMMTTVERGVPRARPMALQGTPAEFDGSLWFFTDKRNPLMQEIADNQRLSLIFQSDDEHAYLQLWGRGIEDLDRAKMLEIYSPAIKTWFPDGIEDPNLTMIRFEADEGHFWDSPGGVFRLLGAFAKSMVTGEPSMGGEKGEVHLHS